MTCSVQSSEMSEGKSSVRAIAELKWSLTVVARSAGARARHPSNAPALPEPSGDRQERVVGRKD